MRAAPAAAALAALLLGLPAGALEVVDVRVAEHPDFTRVVIELDAAGDPHLTRAGEELLLTLDADARPVRIAGEGSAVEWVQLEPTPEGSLARIRLARADLSVQQRLLAGPPRVIVEVHRTPAGPSPLPAPAGALDATTHAFTGFQMDDETQYFAFLGLKRDVWQGSGLAAYVHLFGAGQSYEYETGGRDIDTDLQLLTPSLGLSHAFGDGALSVSAHVGPRFEWKREDGFSYGSRSDFEVGVLVQAESLYWQETHSVQAIASYASSDDFFFGRLRGKLRVASPASGCCALFTGLDVAGMGNRDFDAVQTGPLIEVPVAGFFVLARGGYQYDSTFHSGAYGGLEIYAPF